jgi:hypothetical protein
MRGIVHFMKPCLLALFGMIVAVPAFAANYEAIDPGDIYLINRFGKNNSTVMVERKLASPMVKVRDINTGVTSVESADDLLSETELRREETQNKALGWGAAGLGLCMLSGKCQ